MPHCEGIAAVRARAPIGAPADGGGCGHDGHAHLQPTHVAILVLAGVTFAVIGRVLLNRRDLA